MSLSRRALEVNTIQIVKAMCYNTLREGSLYLMAWYLTAQDKNTQRSFSYGRMLGWVLDVVIVEGTPCRLSRLALLELPNCIGRRNQIGWVFY